MRLIDDVRYAFRLLRRTPGFTLIAIAALALGIGANTAMFSVVNAVLIRPLPYEGADRVGIIWERSPGQGWNRINPSGPDALDFREQASTLEQVAVIETGSGTVNGMGEPQQVPGMRVSTNLLQMLGIKPILGRDFNPGEGWKDRVIILSYGAWHRWFGGDRKAIGKRLLLDGLSYTIIGVLPQVAFMPLPSEAYVPWADSDLRGMNRMEKRLGVLARLKPGVTWKQASDELDAIEHRIAESNVRMKDWTAYVLPFQDWMSQRARPALLLMLAAVGMVLLIACTNLANLMLARAAGRERDIAVRLALGAGRGVLVRQFLTEAIVLGLLGGAAGLILAVWGADLLNRIVPATLRMPDSNTDFVRPRIVIDGVVLAFTAGVSLLSALLFGLAPAVASARAGLGTILRGSRGSAGAHTRNLRDALVVAEIALALVLLVAATLAIESFWNLQKVQPGFASDHVLVVETELPTDSKYRTANEMMLFHRRVLEKVAEVPGVSAVGLTCSLPMDEEDHKEDFRIIGKPLPPSGQLLSAHFRSVSPGYFSALRIPLMRGRMLEDSDSDTRPPVVLIDEVAAQRYFTDGTDPIGQKIGRGKSGMEIVGIVGPVRNDGLGKEPEPTIYMSYQQNPEPQVRYVVRHPTPEGIVKAVKNAFYSVDKDQPVFNIRTMDEVVVGSEAGSKLMLVLIGTFALVALVLASLGIYGVVSYAVTQRTNEIGIRMALGASIGDVMRLVMRSGLRLVAIGVGAGIAAALLASRLLASLLYGVGAANPLVFGGTALLLAAVALTATLLPALRASRTSPIMALRYE